MLYFLQISLFYLLVFYGIWHIDLQIPIWKMKMGNNSLDVSHFRGVEANFLLNCSGSDQKDEFWRQASTQNISKGLYFAIWYVYNTTWVVNSED